jgi:hypothetical protein
VPLTTDVAAAQTFVAERRDDKAAAPDKTLCLNAHNTGRYRAQSIAYAEICRATGTGYGHVQVQYPA